MDPIIGGMVTDAVLTTVTGTVIVLPGPTTVKLVVETPSKEGFTPGLAVYEN